MVAVKTFAQLAASTLPLELPSDVCTAVTAELCSFLRKSNRQLRQARERAPRPSTRHPLPRNHPPRVTTCIPATAPLVTTSFPASCFSPQASLVALEAIVSHRSAALAPQVVLDVLSELTPLISDADLHLAHLALVLVRAAVTAVPAVAMGAVDEMILPRALALLTSSLLQATT